MLDVPRPGELGVDLRLASLRIAQACPRTIGYQMAPSAGSVESTGPWKRNVEVAGAAVVLVDQP
jgi:hypothetical protein